jgi:EmrB/QacA subfamily drug resistance transporter
LSILFLSTTYGCIWAMDSSDIQRYRYRFFAVGAIGTFMATLDGSILNVALPSIATDLNAPVSMVAWVVLAYALTLISLLMVFGAWTERRGYRFAYNFGFVFFLTGSTLCAFSQGIYFLIVARVIQAVGCAMFAAVGPGMVTTVFPPKERGQALGLNIMMVSAGFMVGPPLGGLILSHWSWPAIFVINLPVGLLGLYLTRKYFRLLEPPKNPRTLRLLSPVSIGLALVCGIFALSLLDNYPVSDPRVWGLGICSLLLLAVFLKLESIPERALIGLAIFKNHIFTASLGAQLMHFTGLSGVTILIPFYLQDIKHFPPQQVGFFLVILPVMMFVWAPLAGRLSDKIGFQVLTCSGMTIMAGGLWLLSSINPVTSDWYIITCLVVIGAGVGLFSTPNSSALMGAVTPDQRAVASGVLATNRNIGVSIGVAFSTALFTHFQRLNAGLGDPDLIFVASYRPVIYVGIGFAALGFVFCLVRGNRHRPEVLPENG